MLSYILAFIFAFLSFKVKNSIPVCLIYVIASVLCTFLGVAWSSAVKKTIKSNEDLKGEEKDETVVKECK